MFVDLVEDNTDIEYNLSSRKKINDNRETTEIQKINIAIKPEDTTSHIKEPSIFESLDQTATITPPTNNSQPK